MVALCGRLRAEAGVIIRVFHIFWDLSGVELFGVTLKKAGLEVLLD